MNTTRADARQSCRDRWHWATVGSSNLDPFSLLLSLEANVVVDDEGFAKELKFSLEQAMETGAQRIGENNWRTQSIGQRLASWLSYGVVRFMIGIAGMPRANCLAESVPIDHAA
jgi:cardiolipin synthase